jgi:hypothetical protein
LLVTPTLPLHIARIGDRRSVKAVTVRRPPAYPHDRPGGCCGTRIPSGAAIVTTADWLTFLKIFLYALLLCLEPLLDIVDRNRCAAVRAGTAGATPRPAGGTPRRKAAVAPLDMGSIACCNSRQAWSP